MQDSVGGPSPELARGVSLLCSLQREDGSVAGEVVWSPVITAQYVLTAYMIGQPIESQRQARFLRYFRQTQTADSGWGLHPESRGYVFVTALVYVALRLLGLSAADPLCLQARLWLREHGGVESIPSWGKLWLAMMNLYGYEGVNPVLPEAWLLPRTLPLHHRQTNGVSLSPVNGLLNVLALTHAGYREGEEAFRGLDYWAWQDQEGGERFCGAHSQTWDTSFAVQALCEGPERQTASRFLSGA